MSPLITQHPLPPALDTLLCSVIASSRNGVLSPTDGFVILEQLQMAKWYAKVTGGRDATIAELDLAVAIERLTHALAPQNPTVPA